MSRRNQSNNRRSAKIQKRIAGHLEKISLFAAGIDIGSESHYVAIPEELDDQPVREFSCFTTDLEAMASWLVKLGITTVVMESTGVYWIPVFKILESHGLDVKLVNARHVKNVSGRKSDVLDCQWLLQLHTYGLLEGAFRPDEQVCSLRAYMRQRDPKELARHRDKRCQKSEEEIAKSLKGHYRAEHLFALQQAAELYDTYGEKILACDVALEKQLEKFDSKVEPASSDDPGPDQPAKKRKSRSAPSFDVRSQLKRMSGVDLTRIDGIDENTALKILSEIGLDMCRWPSAKHFAFWLGLCPGTNTKSALGAYCRRMRSKMGSPKAITATAHKLARLVSSMLKHGSAYVDKGQDYYEREHKDRVMKNLKKKAEDMGFMLVPAESVANS